MSLWLQGISRRTQLATQPGQRKGPGKAVVAQGQGLSQGTTALLLSAQHPGFFLRRLPMVEEFRESFNEFLKLSGCFSVADMFAVGLGQKRCIC